VSLKEEIDRQLRISTRIRIGGPGALDIYADGKKIFSKKQTGRMPEAAEIIQALRNRT